MERYIAIFCAACFRKSSKGFSLLLEFSCPQVGGSTFHLTEPIFTHLPSCRQLPTVNMSALGMSCIYFLYLGLLRDSKGFHSEFSS